MEPVSTANEVRLVGKISRVGRLGYTPSGVPVCEFTVAVSQKYFDKASIGYFEAIIVGPAAEEHSARLRIGKKFTFRGTLWARTFRNRTGAKVSETKVLVDSIEGET